MCTWHSSLVQTEVSGERQDMDITIVLMASTPGCGKVWASGKQNNTKEVKKIKKETSYKQLESDED